MAELYRGVAPKHWKKRFVKTGECRPPVCDEWYLSGAIPEVWQARGNLTDAYSIMREANYDKEVICPTCGQERKVR